MKSFSFSFIVFPFFSGGSDQFYQDPFGAQSPFGMNAEDIFKSFFGDQKGFASGGFGFEQARQTQVDSYRTISVTLILSGRG